MYAKKEPVIELFIKAGSGGKNIGCCPSSQRLFMILLLKKIHFKVTPVDVHRKSAHLANLAPGTQPPFLTFNGGVKTDTLKIEEFLEDILCPPRYPKLAVQYPGSNSAGRDIFSRFSLYIRNTSLASNAAQERALMHTLEILDLYLTSPLPREPGEGPSKRSFLDGNHLTLADCTLLPKLNVIRVVLGRYRGLDILERFSGIERYMRHAIAQNEFSHSCPTEQEIERAYFTIAQSLK
uniref:chloride intracellular channel protein 4-like n=1 Tax=Myxine glutinosa TaxID=7769 RepID=UPI00358E07A9